MNIPLAYAVYICILMTYETQHNKGHETMTPTTIIIIATIAILANVAIVAASMVAHSKMNKSIDRSLTAIEDNAKQWDAMAAKHGFDWRN